VHAPRHKFCKTFVFMQKELTSDPPTCGIGSFNKLRWPLPQVRQGKMEGAFLRQDFPLVHAEQCSGGSKAESLTRSHLIGRARSMAEEWAAQGKACGADATTVELEVCELLEIYPPGAGTWGLEHLCNRLPESFSLASSAPASTASPPRSTSSSTGKLAAPTSSSTGLEWWTAGGEKWQGKSAGYGGEAARNKR